MSDPQVEKIVSELYSFTDTLARKMNHKEPSKVLSYLYIGSGSNAKDRGTLKRLGVNAVLNLSPLTVMTGKYYYPDTWEYKEINAIDNDEYPIDSHFDDIYGFIEDCKDDGKIILVHCGVGVSRASSAVISYLINGMKENKVPSYVLEDFRKEQGLQNQIPEQFIDQMNEMEEPLRPFTQAFLHVIYCRPIIEPNKGFREKLWTFTRNLFPVQ